jgi:hypothetical protein
MSTYNTPQKSNGVSGRSARVALDKETVARARATPWEPGAASGAPRVLVGLVGAGLIGAVAVAIVLLSPSHVAKPVHADPAAVTQPAPAAAAAPSAETLAAQMNAEPAAAGKAADTPTPSAAKPAPADDAPDLRTTRDPHPAPGSTNPPNGE